MKSDLKGCFLFWLEKKKIGCIQVLVLPTNYSSKSRWPERTLETVICRNDTSGITTFWTWPWHMTQKASSFSLSQTSAGICSNSHSTHWLLTRLPHEAPAHALSTAQPPTPQLPNSGERGHTWRPVHMAADPCLTAHLRGWQQHSTVLFWYTENQELNYSSTSSINTHFSGKQN